MFRRSKTSKKPIFWKLLKLHLAHFWVPRAKLRGTIGATSSSFWSGHKQNTRTAGTTRTRAARASTPKFHVPEWWSWIRKQKPQNRRRSREQASSQRHLAPAGSIGFKRLDETISETRRRRILSSFIWTTKLTKSLQLSDAATVC